MTHPSARKPEPNELGLAISRDGDGRPVWYTPTPYQVRLHASEAYLRAIIAGYGCIAGETLIFNPDTGQSERVDEIHMRGLPHRVLALGTKGPTPTWAACPVIKGVNRLYRVTLETGETITVTDRHAFLIERYIWLPLAGRAVGDKIATLEGESRISAIEFVRYDAFYDFHVPIYENYLASGVWNHNSGKTMSGAAEMLRLYCAYDGCRLLDVSPSYQQARRTTIETYCTMLEATFGPGRWKYNKTDHEFSITGYKSKLWIGSGDNPDSLKGPNITHARIDEPFIQSRAVFDQIVARVRRNDGPLGIILTGTPEQLNWGYDLICGNETEADKELAKIDPRLSAAAMTREIIRASSRENPYLPPTYIASMYQMYDAQMARAYIDGEFVSLATNQAYHAFDPNRNIAPVQYDPGLRLFLSWDFNVEPLCGVIVQQHDNIDHVIDEIMIPKNATVERACDAFLAKYGQHKAGVTITGDPAGNARNVQSGIGGWNNYTIIRERLGNMPGFAQKVETQCPITSSINKTNALLVNAANQVSMLIAKDCKALIKDLERVTLAKVGDAWIPDKKSDKTLTHASDALRYYVWTFRSDRGYGGHGLIAV